MTQNTRAVPRHMDLIYDVGLHKGEDTAYYLKNGFRVIAFEADPDLVRLNEERFSQSIKQGNLIIVDGAIVGDPSAKEVTFYKNLKESEWGTIDPERVQRNVKLGTPHRSIRVPAINFEECIIKFGIPYYMKIDIESADRICLEILKQFTVKPCYVSIESEKVHFENLVRELDIFSELGYTKFSAVAQAAIHKLKRPIRSKEGKHISYRFPHGSSGPFGQDISNWMSMDEVLDEYKTIFKRYQKYGDDTFWGRNKIAKACLYAFLMLCGKPVPGWYDTHARLAECKG